jgi:hypothetical protein
MDRSDAYSERRKIGATGPVGTRRNLLSAQAASPLQQRRVPVLQKLHP